VSINPAVEHDNIARMLGEILSSNKVFANLTPHEFYKENEIPQQILNPESTIILSKPSLLLCVTRSGFFIV
jgi:hypothetical protein